ncbi:Eco57I restriction-modification methylase domain-containing protein, partial [Pseudokineococcus sp. 1T1Z-3]|uniref:Eco57I restriction-modification methylase domain-containing protein n=1 Tax=Pseudokineococcus sp. 1T1Z-3 TaxID=3132745 RepID=UPI00309BAB06
MNASPALAPAAQLARVLGARGSRATVGEADPAGPLSSATRAVLAGAASWWRRRVAAAGLDATWADPTTAIGGLGGSVDADQEQETTAPSSGPDLLTVDGWTLGQAYTASLAPGARARHGRHYTPATLAEVVWARARTASGAPKSARALPGRVLDPSCGAGALLLPPLREHLQATRAQEGAFVLAGLPRLVSGVDADPVAAWIANVVLAAEMLPTLQRTPPKARRPLPRLVEVGDGLADHGSAHTVLMNPPYGRVRLTAEDRARFAHVLWGHANLYAMFVAAGLSALEDGGVLSALVPTSLTAGRYSTNLRGALAREAALRDVVFVADRSGSFAGVLQETCVATFSGRRHQHSTVAAVEDGETVEVARVPAPRGDGPWLLPRGADDAAVAAAAATMPNTLRSSGWRVSTGPLVWNRRSADLHPRAGGQRLRVVWAADIDGGRLHRDKARDHTRWLRMRDAHDRAVNALTGPAVLVQRTTAPEQARRLVAADLSPDLLEQWGGSVVVENHVNVLR